MAAWNYINTFPYETWLGAHDLHNDQVKIYLSNVQPVVTNTVFDTPAEITGALNGYTAGGEDTINTMTDNPTGTAELVANGGGTIVWTATAGGIATFQFVVAYNFTHASAALLGWYDHGSGVSLADGESFTVDFAANWLTFTETA
jgi:hypothetical protein